MSIFKFMVDNQYFVNSDIELENFTLIKEKAVKPEFSSSENKSENENDKSLSNGSSRKMLKINTSGIDNIKNEESKFNAETKREDNNIENDFNVSFANSIDIKFEKQNENKKKIKKK